MPKFDLSGILADLRAGRWDKLSESGREVVAPLLEVARNRDKDIAARARQILLDLRQPDARVELCRHAGRLDNGVAAELAIEAGYFPPDLSERALFYFLTEQWEAYDGLDFDRRLLRVLYETGQPDLRRQIALKVQAAGRVEYLGIIAGPNYTSASFGPTAEEAALLVQILADKGEWARLWELVRVLPLEWSVSATRHLLAGGWQPDRPDEQATLAELGRLVAGPLAMHADGQFDGAVRRARVRVAGKVRALAFGPTHSRLAIATGNRQVILWNLQYSQIETVLDGFHHPVGVLTFMPDGTLVCGEKPASSASLSRIWGWRGGPLFEIGRHQGAVTALQELAGGLVLSLGRDGRAVIWALDGGSFQILTEPVRGWTPALCCSPDQQRLAVLHDQIELYELTPTLRWRANSPLDLTNSLRHGAFSPDGQTLATGRFNGQLTTWQIGPNGTALNLATPGLDVPARPGTTVEGLATLRDAAMLLLATSDGVLQYVNWPTRRLLGQSLVPGKKLTSIRLSPDEAFLAVGDNDASFSLWDLRLLSLSRLFSDPLAGAGPGHLNALLALNSLDLTLPSPLASSLGYIEAILRGRFRYEVELGEVGSIGAGEFDIELTDFETK